MRTIKVVSTTAGTKVTIETSVSTWGQLKKDSKMASLLGSNMTAVVRETKVNLEHDDAVLPTGDFTIFLVQTKTKAGLTRAELEEILDAHMEEAKEAILEDLTEALDIEEDEDELMDEARSFEL